MYKVLKDRGYYANVTLLNTDSGNSLMIGRVRPNMLDILKKEYDALDAIAPMRDIWDLTVTKETSEELMKTTMPMRRPPRRPKKEKVIIPDREVVETPVEETKEPTTEVNALDVLLGFAHYNNEKGSDENG